MGCSFTSETLSNFPDDLAARAPLTRSHSSPYWRNLQVGLTYRLRRDKDRPGANTVAAGNPVSSFGERFRMRL